MKQAVLLEISAAIGILAHSMGHSKEPIKKQVKNARLAARMLMLEYKPVLKAEEKRSIKIGKIKTLKTIKR